MSNIKKYTLSEWNDSKVVIVVDHDKATDELFHTMNDFWSESEERLSDADGDVVIAVLKMIALYCLNYQTYHQLNSYGMMRHFGSDDSPSHGVEGYPRLDGSMGILLEQVDVPEIEIDDDVEVTDLIAMPNPPKGFS